MVEKKDIGKAKFSIGAFILKNKSVKSEIIDTSELGFIEDTFSNALKTHGILDLSFELLEKGDDGHRIVERFCNPIQVRNCVLSL